MAAMEKSIPGKDLESLKRASPIPLRRLYLYIFTFFYSIFIPTSVFLNSTICKKHLLNWYNYASIHFNRLELYRPKIILWGELQ